MQGSRLIRKYQLIGVLVAAAILLSACATWNGLRKGAPANDVEKATLSNGLQVVLVRNPLAPVVTQQITYFVGSNQSPAGFPGTAHAQEHMLFRGSPGLTGDQLDEISAQLGGDMNAYTTQNVTSYYFTAPAEALDLVLRIGATRMRGATDSEADWEKERGAIEQEVASDNSDPFYVLFTRALENLFVGTPYVNAGLGDKPTFDLTTAQILKGFHDTWYWPNNALMVLTGDIDVNASLSRIKELYGDIPSKSVPSKPPITLQPITAATYSSPTDQPYGIVALAFRMPGYESDDYAAAYVLSQALDSQRGPIVALTYDGKALSSGFGMNTMTETGVGFAYALYPPGGDAKALESELRDAVAQTVRGGISNDLVTSISRKAVLSSNLERNSIAGLAQAWTNAIALHGVDSPDAVVARLQKIDSGMVDAEASKVLDFNHAVTLLLAPSPAGTGGSGRSGFGSPESFGSTPAEHVTLPDWANAAIQILPNPTPLYKPSDVILPNGLRLIVLQLNESRAVSLYGVVRTSEGIEAPKGTEGVEDLMNSLFDWGPVGLTRLQFEESLDKIGSEASIGTDFSLSVDPAYFDEGVRLVSAALLNPSLPQDAFESQQKIAQQEAAGRVSSPLYMFRRAVQSAIIPSDDPSLRISTPESISSLTLDTVRNYYRKVMRPDETTIVVAGNISPSDARSVIEKQFGDWKSDGPKPVLDNPKIPPSGLKDTFVADPSRIQDEVVLGETVPVTFDDPDHFALLLGNEFLSGGLFASPLYRELRVQRGLVYSVDSTFLFGRNRGFFQLTYGADPDKVSQAKQVAIDVLKRMAAQPLTADELHLSKAIGLRGIELKNQSVDNIANEWLGYSQQGLPLDETYEIARNYENLSAPQVQAAFAKELDFGRLSTTILGRPIDAGGPNN